MNLPIDVIPNSKPPRFRWKQAVSTPNGTKIIEYEGSVMLTIEQPLLELLALVRQQHLDNVELRKKLELLTPKAAPPQPTPRKGK